MKRVFDLLYTQYSPLLLCLPRKLEKKYDDLVAAQIAVIHCAFVCLMWEGHGTAKGSGFCPAGDVWWKLNPLLEAVHERDSALKALHDTMKEATKKALSRHSFMYVLGGRTVTFAKSESRFQVFKEAVVRYKLKVGRR